MTELGARASRALEPLGDRLSPILVKEVRQALRGRYFRNLFWFTLCGATLVGILVVSRAVAAGELATAGPNVFVAFAWILAIAVHGFVPLSAFISTSSEWDENTYDLLVLSNLRPRQLVLGKLASTVIQALLFYSAFGPLLVFAFLLHGVDLLSIGVMLGCSVVVSASLSVAAIALSTLARGRFTRIVLLGVLAAGLVAITTTTAAMGSALVHMPQVMRSTNFVSGVLVFLSCFLALGLISFPVACARLAHEEENASSGLRAMSLVVLGAGLGWALYMYRTTGNEEHVPGFVLWALVINLVPLLFYATEREPLGRRTRLRVPARRALALAQAPFLPGGGRGILFLVLYSALTVVGALLILRSGNPTGSPPTDPVAALWTVDIGLAYAWIWIGIPAGVGALFARSLAARSAVRVSAPLLAVLAILLPGLAGMFLGMNRWMQLQHPLNPVHMLSTSRRGGIGHVLSGLALLAILFAIAVVLNLPRVRRGVREVLDASREARERAKARDRAALESTAHAVAVAEAEGDVLARP